MGGLTLAGCSEVALDTTPTASATPPPVAATPTPTPGPVAAEPPLGEGVAPARVSIPAIGIDEELVELGIQDTGAMEVPEDYFDVGWFTGGGKPGGRGPTVIAGHVDTGWGPAVFVRLPELVPGDVVDVTDVEGTVARYTVTEVADHLQADFPTQRVFGASAVDELRLITCYRWDREAKAYLDNRVVYAVRADAGG